MYLQLHIFRLQYSTERICAAIGDISTIQCALYCKHGAKYSAHSPVCAIWTVVPDIHNVLTAPHFQASIFNWIYLSCYWRYLDNSMSVILQSLCQIQRTSSGLRYVNCGPGHIQCNYCSAYSGLNIQLNISALLLEISRICKARHTANVVPNTAHTIPFRLCELWFRPYTMKWQPCIFSLQYSTERICAAVEGISTIQWALYCNLGAQIQRISTRLHYVNCAPGYIQSTNSSAYLCFNIQL
jgi:hypothetical protein